MGHGIFFTKEGSLDQATVDKFSEATAATFSSHLIREYLQSIKENVEENKISAKWLQVSQFALLSSIVMIGVLIGFMIDAAFSNHLDLQLFASK
jgi:hypothetical protein